MLNEKIDVLIGENMKSNNTITTEVLRLIKAEFLNFKKQKSSNVLDEAAEIQILKKMSKQREESIKIYKENNREDLANREEKELNIIKSYLPKEASKEEIDTKAKELIQVKDKSMMGVYIKQLKNIFPSADGKLIADIVKENLNN